jgi:hypothetical protein
MGEDRSQFEESSQAHAQYVGCPFPSHLRTLHRWAVCRTRNGLEGAELHPAEPYPICRDHVRRGLPKPGPQVARASELNGFVMTTVYAYWIKREDYRPL